jgi:hypothetical protein
LPYLNWGWAVLPRRPILAFQNPDCFGETFSFGGKEGCSQARLATLESDLIVLLSYPGRCPGLYYPSLSG